ncbi:hypothetical protein RchiOBHm_Chr5g0007811 [Rosa chinensis]|uniref:Uncharacterized protein n=1 Tax=Rosa chinensis TaxID=74649 RepID=A0A2P6Q3X7_ROSCH|nr:hypothetical protein RchiOBHm_Chr5g0007811 [Rosa chinensis]
MSEQFMKKGNYFEQQMNDNQKDEVICERSKTMKWSASDMVWSLFCFFPLQFFIVVYSI